MDWQTTVTLFIVAMAIFFIARNFLGSLRVLGSVDNACGGGGCSTCPANEQNSRAPKQIELVRIDRDNHS